MNILITDFSEGSEGVSGMLGNSRIILATLEGEREQGGFISTHKTIPFVFCDFMCKFGNLKAQLSGHRGKRTLFKSEVGQELGPRHICQMSSGLPCFKY